MEIKTIDKHDKTVHFDDNTFITVEDFKKQFYKFLERRNAGETIIPNDTERFMSRTSSKNLKLLMKGKKMEGYLEGSMDKMLTRGQKIGLITIFTIAIIACVILVILKSQGIL